MTEKEIILSSFSLGDFTSKLFGYSNGQAKKKAIDILEKNGFDLSVFAGKNKNTKYEKISKECPVCRNEFSTLKGDSREKETCSIKCSNSLNPKRVKGSVKKIRVHPKKEKECTICNSNFIGTKKCKTCSKECSNELQRRIMQKKVSLGQHKGWTTRKICSYAEGYFKTVLDNLGLDYEFNFPVSKSSLGINSASCYFLDFYLEIKGKRIDLEIDGKQHNYPERKDSDRSRDKLLLENDFLVYRIEWKNPVNDENRKHLEKEINTFERFLKNL